MAEEFDDAVIGKVQDLLSTESVDYERDLRDLDLSRSVSSGFGWDKEFKDFWGPAKPQMNVNAIQSWTDKVHASYTAAPFTVGLASVVRDITQMRKAFADSVDRNKLSKKLGSVLRDILNDGRGFAVYATEVEDSVTMLQRPVLRIVDARRVVHADCDDPTLKDCDFAIVIDSADKEKTLKRYGLDKYAIRGKDLLTSYDFALPDTVKNCSIITAYEKTETGVRVSKIVYNVVVEQTEIEGLSRIPLARCVGRKIEIDKRPHYRGAYHFVADFLKAMNLIASSIQANVALAEDANWIADIRSVAQNLADWTNGTLSGGVRAVNLGDADRPLPMPVQTNKSPYTSELIATYDMMQRQVAQVLGDVSGEAPKNATAEEILARNESAAATRNMYIDNLQQFAEALGAIELELVMITTDVPRTLSSGEEVGPLYTESVNTSGINVEITDGPIAENKRQRDVMQLMAFADVCVKTGAPNVGSGVMPVILSKMDIDVQEKQFIASKMFPQQGPQVPPEVQAQMAQQAQTMQQMQQYITQLETMVNSNNAKIQADVLMNREDNATTIQKTLIELQGAEAEAQAKIDADLQKSVFKAQADLAKTMAQRPAVVSMGNEMATPMGAYRGF